MPRILLLIPLFAALMTSACSSRRAGDTTDRRYFHSPTPLGSKTGVTYARDAR